MALPPAVKERWDKLNAKQKQMALYGGVVAVLSIVVILFMDTGPAPIQGKKAKPTTDLLTPANTRGMSIDRISAKTTRLESDNEELRKRLAELEGKLTKGPATPAADGSTPPAALTTDDITALKEQIRAELATEIQSGQLTGQPMPPAPPAFGQQPLPQNANPFSGAGVSDVFAQPASAGAPPSPPPPAQPQSGGQPQATGSIRVITEREANPTKPAEQPKGAKAPKPDEMFLPAGGMIRTTLLTGLDAPTHKSARSDPYPVLARVVDDTILPSLRRLDLRECFIIADSFGELSSERALMRTRTLSCIRNDGGAVEVPIQGFASGDDGKVGLRGRVVSKQGTLVARAMAAGVAEGFSSVFRRQAVPVVASSAGDRAQFQSLLSPDSVQSGAAAGVGRALDRLAEYYLDLADQMHAVIEVDAGRTADFIVVSGAAFPALYPQETE